MDELFSSPDLSDFPLSLHLEMLRDSVRMKAYSEAMRSLIKPNDVVVDVGTGTGILAFLAVNYGAKQVYAIDRSRIIDYAKRVKELNCPDAPVSFLQHDILRGNPLETKATIAICELFGNFGIDENVVNILAKVRHEWLTSDGRVVPETLELVAAPVQCTTGYREIASWNNNEYGIDFSPMQQLAYNAIYQVTGEPVRLLGTAKTLAHIDFTTDITLPKKLCANYTIVKEGTLHGVAGWFRSKLAPGHYLDTGPESPPTHWGQVLFPIGDPINVRKGGRVSMQFKEILKDNESQWYWSGKIQPSPNPKTSRDFSYTASRRFFDA